MVGLCEIPRTATFTWSPGTSAPFLATGTKAGAVDEGFSNDTQLELWDLGLNKARQDPELQPAAGISTDSRFNDIAWTSQESDQTRGIIAGALDNGSLDLWSADKLLSGNDNAFISRTSKHGGAIKALQFNVFRSELLATLFISDLSNIGSPFRMGNAVARVDDFDCLDWNKKTAHILATGSSGGTMTVWDIKNKRESLTLNNLGRKPVSAIVWDPVKTTRLITAIPNDTDPVILVWDLRNANAPEKVLKGHDGGVLSLSWCTQDSDLLLSCGKDNRNICWNPQTGESYGEFPVVTNWTFQTRWNPHDPGLMATASFDGKVVVQSTQNTKPETIGIVGNTSQIMDDDDFFSKAANQPQGPRFTLRKAPKWLQRPCGVSFGFGGRIVSFKSGISEASKRSILRISNYVVDGDIISLTNSFEAALDKHDLKSICDSRIGNAASDVEQADWKVIRTLASENPRKDLVEYLGISSQNGKATDGIAKLPVNGSQGQEPQALGKPTVGMSKRLSAFFDNTSEGDTFLSELAATKGAKPNNPFHLYSGSESNTDRRITQALILGEVEIALDVCLQEDRMSDAFMIANCGGQKCIEKVQKAFFNRQAEGPNYLRLLASVVGKNLWDLVHNADLSSWKEIMATICTYAEVSEFPDLCEELGDRLEGQVKAREGDTNSHRNASFCYLVGSRLEKVVSIWILELEQLRGSGFRDLDKESSFSIHARSLQSFIEKVTVFREVTHYKDSDHNARSDWKLAPLYDKYIEYADIASAHGQMHVAERYLDLIPSGYVAAEIAKCRVKQATRKAIPPSTQKQIASANRTFQQTVQTESHHQQQNHTRLTTRNTVSNPYAPVAGPNPSSYASTNGQTFAGMGHSNAPGYQQYQQQPQIRPGAVPSKHNAPYNHQLPGHSIQDLTVSPPVPPPSKASTMSNWNDTPEDFFKAPTSRRGTPSAVMNPPPYQLVQPQNSTSSFGVPPKSTLPLGPPPKGPATAPPRTSSPSVTVSQFSQQPERPPSSAAAYIPHQPTPPLPVQQQTSIPRGPSPYNSPPSVPPSSNRYAPTQPVPTSNNQGAPTMAGSNRQAPPDSSSNPYILQPGSNASQQNAAYQPSSPVVTSSIPSPSQSGSTQGQVRDPRPAVSQLQRKVTPLPSKHPTGDRSHIKSDARPIYEILSHDMQRVRSKAPSSFKAQVNDTEKRLNILFEHLNNEDLLKGDTIQSMVDLAEAIQARDFERAQAIHVDIMTNKLDECGNWMVGVKRLIAMSRATP